MPEFYEEELELSHAGWVLRGTLAVPREVPAGGCAGAVLVHGSGVTDRDWTQPIVDSAFLFPADSFANEVYSVSVPGLVDAKRQWKVSAQVMIRRARDLEMITKHQYERAFRRLSTQGYRRKEPLDDEMEREAPSSLAIRLRGMIESEGFTAADIVSHLRLNAREIELLGGLRPGYLESREVGAGGKILPFRRH